MGGWWLSLRSPSPRPFFLGLRKLSRDIRLCCGIGRLGFAVIDFVQASLARLAPKGPKHTSPGQRPGKRGKKRTCPERAKQNVAGGFCFARSGLPKCYAGRGPRAMPWADMLRPLRVTPLRTFGRKHPGFMQLSHFMHVGVIRLCVKPLFYRIEILLTLPFSMYEHLNTKPGSP